MTKEMLMRLVYDGLINIFGLKEEWTIVERDRTTVIVPSHSTQTYLERLDPRTVYLIEVYYFIRHEKFFF